MKLQLLSALGLGLVLNVNAEEGALSFDVEDAKSRPVSKVITLLKDMQKQLEKDQEEDEAIYNKMACWCKINNKEKSQAIKEQEAKIQQLTVKIEEGTAEIARLETEIENLKKEVAENVVSLDKATALREKQLAEFNGEEKDLLGSIGALKSAIVVLSKHSQEGFLQGGKSGEVKQRNAMLLSVKSVFDSNKDKILESLSTGDAEKLQSFLEQATQVKSSSKAGQPSVAQYSNQSGEIFGILKNMKDTFEENLATSQETEKQNASAFAELKEAKTTEIDAGQKQVDSKVTQLADTKESTATARQDLADTRNSLSADDEFLRMVKEKCSQTDAEWSERQKTRNEEITAVSEALSVLSGDDAHDVFTKTFNPSFVQQHMTQQKYLAFSADVKDTVMRNLKAV